MKQFSIYIGYEPRQAEAYAVTRLSYSRSSGPIPVRGIKLSTMEDLGLYNRPTERRQGLLYDVISEHPMATEFAISRFLTKYLAGSGWALFADCDMLKLPDSPSFMDLFFHVDKNFSDKAIVCVKHDHQPTNLTKMDGQVQSRYSRKNWSSFMLFNCDHPANEALTVELINSVPGRDLHRFCWLGEDDSLIGSLDPRWNYLVGSTKLDVKPYNVHFTEGLPNVKEYEDCEYAEDWRFALDSWVERG